MEIILLTLLVLGLATLLYAFSFDIRHPKKTATLIGSVIFWLVVAVWSVMLTVLGYVSAALFAVFIGVNLSVFAFCLYRYRRAKRRQAERGQQRQDGDADFTHSSLMVPPCPEGDQSPSSVQKTIAHTLVTRFKQRIAEDRNTIAVVHFNDIATHYYRQGVTEALQYITLQDLNRNDHAEGILQKALRPAAGRERGH